MSSDDASALFWTRLRERGVGSVVLSAHGELDLSTAGDLERALRCAVGDGSSVLVDMADVAFMDCAGMRALLRIWQSGADVRLVAPSEAVRRVFELTGMDYPRGESSFPDAPGSSGSSGG